MGSVRIGLDSPSLNAFTSKELLCHHALNRYKMVIKETLQLLDMTDKNDERVASPGDFADVVGREILCKAQLYYFS